MRACVAELPAPAVIGVLHHLCAGGVEDSDNIALRVAEIVVVVGRDGIVSVRVQMTEGDRFPVRVIAEEQRIRAGLGEAGRRGRVDLVIQRGYVRRGGGPRFRQQVQRHGGRSSSLPLPNHTRTGP